MNRSWGVRSLAFVLICVLPMLLAASPRAGADAVPLPRILTSHGRHELVVDGKPYLILGAQVNNSSSYPAMLPAVWPDFTGYSNYPPGAREVDAKALAPFALEYELIGPMAAELADVSFRGDLFGVAEDSAVHVQTLPLGRWKAVVSYGLPTFGNATPPGNPLPEGGVLVGRLGPDEFLVTGVHARVSFELADGGSARQVRYARVEEGTYENGSWKFLRVWNGDQVDWGLNFTSIPQVLHVQLATY